MKTKIAIVGFQGKKIEVRLEPNGNVWFKDRKGYFTLAKGQSQPVKSIREAKSIVIKHLKHAEHRTKQIFSC